jgi:hypothetical protein
MYFLIQRRLKNFLVFSLDVFFNYFFHNIFWANTNNDLLCMHTGNAY